MQYQFLHVTDRELLDRVYRFRYKIWCEELGYIAPNSEKKEQDVYDDYSDQFAILDSNDEICATMRLIHHSPIGYPTEKFLKLDDETKIYRRDRLGEMSRIFLNPKNRNLRDTKILINAIVKSLAYIKIKEHGISYCYGAVDPTFLKLINMFKIPYVPIADTGIYNGAKRYPVILYTNALEYQNPQLIKQWNRLKIIHSLKACRRWNRLRSILGFCTFNNSQKPNPLTQKYACEYNVSYDNLKQITI